MRTTDSDTASATAATGSSLSAGTGPLTSGIARGSSTLVEGDWGASVESGPDESSTNDGESLLSPTTYPSPNEAAISTTTAIDTRAPRRRLPGFWGSKPAAVVSSARGGPATIPMGGGGGR